MGKISLFFSAILVFSILFSCGCLQPQFAGNAAKTAEQQCAVLCMAEKAKGTDFSSGPCIGNPIAEFPDFVCDIAHNPRAAVDDLQENQCSAFAQGQAGHFVELDAQCKLIKTF